MARIFFVLACFATVLLLTNLGVGLWVGDLNGDAAAVKQASEAFVKAKATQDQQAVEEAESNLMQAAKAHEPTKKRHSVHFLLGVFTAVVCVLVNARGLEGAGGINSCISSSLGGKYRIM